MVFWPQFDIPTLILHGDDDQIVPIGAAALRSSKLVKHATLKIYRKHPMLLRLRTETSSMPICWYSLRPAEAGRASSVPSTASTVALASLGPFCTLWRTANLRHHN